MSRSYRHTSVFSVCDAKSERSDKRRANRALRTAIRRAVRDYEDDTVFPVIETVSNRWNFAKDGKFYATANDYPGESIRYFLAGLRK